MKTHWFYYCWLNDTWPMRAYRYVRNRWFRRTHLLDTGLSKGCYHDYVEMMTGALLEIVDGYVSRDKEDAFATVDWTHEQTVIDTKETIIEALRFKYIVRPEMERRLEEAQSLFADSFPIIVSGGRITFGGDESKRDELRDLCCKLEKDLYEETQRMLHKIVDIRAYLWT